MTVKNTLHLEHATRLAQTAAQVAHEAQPYPQDSAVFKGLAALSNAMSAAALRCLTAAMEPETPPVDDTDPAQPVEE